MIKAADASEAASRPDPAGESRRAHAETRPAPGGPWTPPAGEPQTDGREGPGMGRQEVALPRAFGARAGARAGSRRYAALDLGTNNCRLLVAEPARETFRVVDSFSRIVRLGEGLTETGRLGAAAMDRAVAALAVCKRKLEDRQIAAARLIATEACRSAANGPAFLKRVRDEVGLDLELIDRRTEAHLAAAGCLSLLDPGAQGAVLFDIGGGSSEIVWLDRRRSHQRNGPVRAWVSLPVGVVTLAERHGGIHVDARLFEAMVADVRDEFHRFRARDALRHAVAGRGFHFLGTSGTVTTLAGLHLNLARYSRRHVDGLWMEDADVERMLSRLVAMDYEARVANPCIGRERADLVLAGCAIFEAIRREWPCRRLRVADRGLREGILIELMRADGFLRGRPGVRRAAAQP